MDGVFGTYKVADLVTARVRRRRNLGGLINEDSEAA
jgi:hypothetical protein